METELSAKISDQIRFSPRRGTAAQRLIGVVIVVGREHALVTFHELRVMCRAREPLFIDSPEKDGWAVADRIPQLRMQACKQRARRAIPAIPQIAC